MKIQNKFVVPDFSHERRSNSPEAVHGGLIGRRWLDGEEAFQTTLEVYPELQTQLPPYVIPPQILRYVQEQAGLANPEGRRQAPGVSEVALDTLSSATLGATVEFTPPEQQLGGEITNVAVG